MWRLTQPCTDLTSIELLMTSTFVAWPDGEMLISYVILPRVPFGASPASTAVDRQRDTIICLRCNRLLISSIFSGVTMLPERSVGSPVVAFGSMLPPSSAPLLLPPHAAAANTTSRSSFFVIVIHPLRDSRRSPDVGSRSCLH